MVLSVCLYGLFSLSVCTCSHTCTISAASYHPNKCASYFAVSFGMTINSILLTLIVLIDPAFELAPEIYCDILHCSKSSLISIKYQAIFLQVPNVVFSSTLKSIPAKHQPKEYTIDTQCNLVY